MRVSVEWSDTDGVINFAPAGRCILRATDHVLALRLEAADEETLRRIQDLITQRLEGFGRRDHLAVTWKPPRRPAERHTTTDTADEQPRAGDPAPAPRRRRNTVLLTTAAALGIALVVAVHLGLGAAAVAASRWLGWTAAGLVIVPVLAHAVAPVGFLGLRHHVSRRRPTHRPARFAAAHTGTHSPTGHHSRRHRDETPP
jgi:hypothetical protein